MDNKKLFRLVFAGGALAFVFVLVRNRVAIRRRLPRSLKDAVTKSVVYQGGAAAINRRKIAGLAARGKLFHNPPEPEEAVRILRDWDQMGRPLPGPGPFKQATLRAYAQKFGLATLVETGTFTGDTPAALKNDFQRIYSIELNPELVRRGRERFRNDFHISILHGDSEERLPEVLATLTEAALFWLDGHYSGGVTSLGARVTPILGELEAVFAHPIRGHVLLIDDAHDFLPRTGASDFGRAASVCQPAPARPAL